MPKFEVFGQLFKFQSLNFSDLHILTGRHDGPVAEKNSRAKFGPCLDLSPNYFCLQIYFLNCYSSEFIHFAYYDRQQCYLAYSGGTVVEKKF